MDLAAVVGKQAEQAFERCRLTGTIQANQAMYGTGYDIEIEIPKHLMTAIRFVKPGDGKNGILGASTHVVVCRACR